MVISQGSHLSFKKCTMKTRVSILALRIHKSKLMVQELQDLKVFYFSLVFFAILDKFSLTMVHTDGNIMKILFLN
jgi:hypothetical protein